MAVVVNLYPPELLVSNKSLYMGEWQGIPISRCTMGKERKRWGLVPVCYWGPEPMFLKSDVEKARDLRHNTLLVTHGERSAVFA